MGRTSAQHGPESAEVQGLRHLDGAVASRPSPEPRDLGARQWNRRVRPPRGETARLATSITQWLNLQTLPHAKLTEDAQRLDPTGMRPRLTASAIVARLSVLAHHP